MIRWDEGIYNGCFKLHSPRYGVHLSFQVSNKCNAYIYIYTVYIYIYTWKKNLCTYGLNFWLCVCALNKHNAGDRVNPTFDDTLPFSSSKWAIFWYTTNPSEHGNISVSNG